MHSKKAFTLIELLIVIAIIGILAGIVLISTTSGRDKAKDAAIMQSAKSMMSAIQTEALISGNYSAYCLGWFGSTSNCNAFSSLPNGANLVAACQSMISNIGSAGHVSSPSTLKIYLGSTSCGAGVVPNLTVMAALPGSQKFFCAGSNGGSSQATDLSAAGCGGGANSWLCSGCYSNP